MPLCYLPSTADPSAVSVSGGGWQLTAEAPQPDRATCALPFCCNYNTPTPRGTTNWMARRGAAPVPQPRDVGAWRVLRGRGLAAAGPVCVRKARSQPCVACFAGTGDTVAVRRITRGNAAVVCAQVPRHPPLPPAHAVPQLQRVPRYREPDAFEGLGNP